jgi:hypothetical protein
MPKEPFIIEICAGSARVTSCLQSLGLSASFGVNHKRQKNAGRVLVADLTSEEGQQLWLVLDTLAKLHGSLLRSSLWHLQQGPWNPNHFAKWC